ncbi:MAG: PP2C family serine/threonine-protein phosphatase [Propionicimonas sp.]|uniref:PP2C family protein-serine/threonine phosphatase n=1 Tax=Propionicimonas sp. TaxID=1955623 RepID=UPI002B1F8372|nr:PP2C family serine/threonine-protein phosphatase [Propionicimonas sp.]MEA4944160.1 PP2C family serine/threonine-protein phosphatase [Propionicimonas sp.]MEA5119090.1 PP2C family serine/threonine-protein phosphatase [Propionicimonas sp.]
MSESDQPWPLFDSGGPAPSPATGGRCPVCTYPVTAWASFCEGCGAPLLPTEPPPLTEPSTGGSTQTRRLGVAAAAPACPQCGGSIGPDGYCLTCGAKAPSPGDHLEASPAGWVAGACDRGLVHHRNEDAMALWADADLPRAVLVVCDGVSTSDQADVASLAGAERACEVLVDAVETEAAASLEAALVRAAAEANTAIAEATSADSENAGSATFAAAVVADGAVHYANLGDSRVYWLAAEEQLLLSTDDSVAQAFIDQGMSRGEAEAMPSAHAITRWLGRDAESVVPRTGVFRPSGPGWLLVCTDGLWNYASEPSALAAQLAAAAAEDDSPLPLARRLVVWANAQGGHDNVTVALARLTGAVPDSGSLAGEQREGTEGERHDG